MWIVIVIVAAISAFIYLFINQSSFGKIRDKEELQHSPNYQKGEFRNLSPTPTLVDGANRFSIMRKFIFPDTNRIPPTEIPTVKTDLRNLDLAKDVLVWLGHSSYFMQIGGKRMLVDPVLSGAASPVPFMIRPFPGANAYTADDIPTIDYLFITHDHWDHLDYKTMIALKPRIGKIITGIGTGEHFLRWGFDKNAIMEGDWYDEIPLDSGFTTHITPARHFSGRGTKPNQSLWASIVLKTPQMQIFIGGDGGYDTHFAEIGKRFGSFDLAVLENGQYNANWRYIHLMPCELLQAAQDLGAKRILPVHNSKFALAAHEWNQPMEELFELNKVANLNLITPTIGEVVNLEDTTQVFRKWWTDSN